MYHQQGYQYQGYQPLNAQSANWTNQQASYNNWNNQNPYYYRNSQSSDYGSRPFVIDMKKVTKANNTFRTALWTGTHLQLTLMSIGVGEDIGLEVHPHLDQFLRIEEGQGLVQMGDSKERLDFQQNAFENTAIFVPAGKWHNLTNTGNIPLKLYSIYAPPEHPYGTVHQTKQIAMAAEERNY
ncbi:cupin domain-containing protein [Bacillus alkalicellulosilyticus]|uniref:cupin domain-containing protein n=1 Tax=Alkalihalobacterium alkalicellulosilyticum TaxID=1912214 RepID=UPI00099676BE|nr:cupin domain-containing protein [Bacillus alkalicellulosilyticus]